MNSPANHLNVLVLEDEWMIADQIAQALDEGGYAVLGPVGRVEQAMQLMAGERVDAAVLDINLHNDRSYRLAAELCRRAIPFAFLSGYSDFDLPAEFCDRPLMQKPVDASTMRRCIEELLPSTRTRR